MNVDQILQKISATSVEELRERQRQQDQAEAIRDARTQTSRTKRIAANGIGQQTKGAN